MTSSKSRENVPLMLALLRLRAERLPTLFLSVIHCKASKLSGVQDAMQGYL